MGLAGVVIESAGAAGTLPTTINEVVSATGLLNTSNCPAALASYTPTPPVVTDLQSAVNAVSAGQTIYICAGGYLMNNTTTYSTKEIVTINKAVTIDGFNWNVAPSGSDTSASVDPTSQSEFELGAGFVVTSPNVTISGLTFYENQANTNPICFTIACGTSIDVQSFNTGPGDMGENNVVVQNNLFVNTGGVGGTFQDGMVHFGLGEDQTSGTQPPTTDVTAVDSGDQVLHNVFVEDTSFENNAVQMSDTTGGNVQFNTVNYPSVDDNSLSALIFQGFDPSLVVENNTLNGGGIDSDSAGSASTTDPKSGIKLIDADTNGDYGNGCSGQQIENNTVTGFVYDIAVISLPYDDTAAGAPCGIGPTAYTVSGNTVSHATLVGIYISDTTAGTITQNIAATNGLITAGHYDYTDNDNQPLPNTWTSNFGNGFANPSSISDTPTTTIAATTTTVAATTTTVAATTTTTLPPVPVVRYSAVKYKSTGVLTATLSCSTANCAGVFKLTRTTVKKVEIGKTKRYKTVKTTVTLGSARYSLREGSKKTITVDLNSTGLKDVRATPGHKFSCSLTITTSRSTEHKTLTFAK
jgi:parallel beta-helix repeat protein